MGEEDWRIGTRSQANLAFPRPEISPEEERLHRASADSRRNPVPDAEGGRREANSSLATLSRERRPFPGFQNRGEVYSCAFAFPFDTVTWTGSHGSRPGPPPPGRPARAASGGTRGSGDSRPVRGWPRHRTPIRLSESPSTWAGR